MHSFLDALQSRFRDEQILQNESMKNHTTFRIGGSADYLILPETEEEIGSLLKICSEYNKKHMIIGNGSNLLFSDDGYKGVIIKLAKNYNNIEIDGSRITAASGILLSSLARTALDNGLAGLEFASGIPGSLGGAVYMNAGAYGGEMKDVFYSCHVINAKGETETLYADDMCFGYRHCALQSADSVITNVTVELTNGSYDDIKGLMDSYNLKRKEKQPLDLPSAGSAFKRPAGFYAGKLIEDAGLKGFSIGGAQVSEKHAGFIVNKGGASCKDVTELINHIKMTVHEQFGIELVPEIKII